MFIELIIIISVILILSKENPGSFMDDLKGQSILIALFVMMMIFLFLNLSVVRYINILLYLCLLVFVYLNRSNYGFKFVIIGVGMNFLTIITNFGLMPVSEKALRVIGDREGLMILKEGLSQTHVLMRQERYLNFLGDIIPLPPPYPFPKLISIGDIFIFIGIVVFVFKGVKKGGKI